LQSIDFGYKCACNDKKISFLRIEAAVACYGQKYSSLKLIGHFCETRGIFHSPHPYRNNIALGST